MEAFEAGSRVDDVAGGKDVDLLDDVLAVITVITTLITDERHCYRFLRVRGLVGGDVGWKGTTAGGSEAVANEFSTSCDKKMSKLCWSDIPRENLFIEAAGMLGVDLGQ